MQGCSHKSVRGKCFQYSTWTEIFQGSTVPWPFLVHWTFVAKNGRFSTWTEIFARDNTDGFIRRPLCPSSTVPPVNISVPYYTYHKYFCRLFETLLGNRQGSISLLRVRNLTLKG